MNTTTRNILNFINLHSGCTEKTISKMFFNNRILPARQFLQCHLWAGVIRPFNGGYVFVQVVAQAPAAPVMDAFQTAYFNF